MSGIVELQGGASYPEAVASSFEADAVVIRNFIDDETSQRILKFKRGIPQHVLCNWERDEVLGYIPHLEPARKAIKEGVNHHFGRFSTLNINIRRLQEELIMRRGGIKSHVDRAYYIGATAINVQNGAGPTYFYAERIASVDANSEDITFAVGNSRKERGHYPRHEITLGSGDAVVLTRGVEHRVVADRDRVALAVGSKVLALF